MAHYSKVLIVIVSLFTFSIIKAQHFSPFNESNVSFFSNTEGSVKALKVDSIKTDGFTEIAYFNKVWNYSDYSCIQPNGPSWAGEKCIKASNTYCFFNRNNDTIVIKPNETLMSSWILYKYEDGRYIQAQISAKKQIDILSVSDSVKTISLQLISKNGEPVADAIKSLEIQISKNYGFTRLFDILNFPESLVSYSIIGMTDPKMGKTFLTDREIYDYNIDDEFHYDIAYSDAPFGSGTFSKTIKKVIGKTMSANTDTVIYSVKRTSETWKKDWGTSSESFEFTMDTIEEKHVFQNHTLYIPEEPITNYDEYNYSSYFLNITSNNRLVFAPSVEEIVKFYDHCWTIAILDGIGSASYLEGCGLYNYDFDNFPSQDHQYLVYYKKSGETWGTPLTHIA